MADIVNSLVYAEEWTDTLQAELDEPNKWKDICNVEYTNTKVLHNPYLTDMTVQSYSRGSVYTHQAITETDDNVNISTTKIAPQYLDRADMAQMTFYRQMDIAKRQAVLLNEAIESAVFAAHASFTDFDNASIGGSAGSITVSATNIDDIITGIRREIREANGEGLLERNGGFIVWRPADMELLEKFCMANGYQFADNVLENGLKQGKNALGFTHYTSNLLTAQHVVAGVKKAIHLGILRDTYGQIVVNDKDPGEHSGVSVVSRVDYAVKVWNKMVPVVFDVIVV